MQIPFRLAIGMLAVLSLTIGWGIIDSHPAEATEVNADIDIRPGSCPNPLKGQGGGFLPVAILGIDELDVTQIDTSTILISRYDGTGGSLTAHDGPPGPAPRLEDVSTPRSAEPPVANCTEDGADGFTDLILKFRVRDLIDILQLTAEPPGDIGLQVSFNLLDGTPFVGHDVVKWINGS